MRRRLRQQPSIAWGVGRRVRNSPIAAIIAKSANAYVKKDLRPAATVRNWTPARSSVRFSNMPPTQKKICALRQPSETCGQPEFSPPLYFAMRTLRCAPRKRSDFRNDSFCFVILRRTPWASDARINFCYFNASACRTAKRAEKVAATARAPGAGVRKRRRSCVSAQLALLPSPAVFRRA